MSIPEGSKTKYEAAIQAVIDLMGQKLSGNAPVDYDTQFASLYDMIGVYEQMLSLDATLAASETSSE